jgi:hypothetical protein
MIFIPLIHGEEKKRVQKIVIRDAKRRKIVKIVAYGSRDVCFASPQVST